MHDIDLTKILIDVALKSNMIHKHGCVILHRNKIISTGYNYYKISNGTIYKNIYGDYQPNRYSIHAEKNAIQKIKNKNLLKECKIYIIRIKKSDDNISYGLEQGVPCNMCNNLLKKYNLTKIINLL
jgi:deoxycytidylate deaminase|uniref:CMP/dCMP-type deaminase domain-containing protein n=1 Tax=viral metagenome TaxID=1070528 RepID=A0A6C0EEG8_9ZZZZ